MCQGGQPNGAPNGSRRDWWQDMDLKALAEQLKAGKVRPPMLPRYRVQVWLIRASTSILLWMCVIQLTAIGELWHPRILKSFPACLDHFSSSVDTHSIPSVDQSIYYRRSIFPLRKYKSNGYLMVSCNGGLNQMRAAICDMVAVARYLNVTLAVPQLDKTSFWADPSDFQDIFDANHFVTSLRDEVRIVKKLPTKYRRKLEQGNIFSMPPISWSNYSYYFNQILPLIQNHKVLHLNKTDARLANNGLPMELQKLRCRVNYESLRFTPNIEELGRKLVKILRANGAFIVLHLRYEMDMLAFSGCTQGCTNTDVDELTRMRYAYPWWKEKIIMSDQKRRDGLCPLTPEETALVLKALGFDRHTQIYIAAGEIYGGEKRMALLHSAYPNIVRKEMLLSPRELKPFVNRSSQMAALDYIVSLASDVFIPTYDGNMAKVVEGHRRFLGFRKTILLDRKRLVELLDQHNKGTLQWDEFSLAVKQAHENRMGAPKPRRMIADKPKEEDYFYANPQECLPGSLPLQPRSDFM